MEWVFIKCVGTLHTTRDEMATWKVELADTQAELAWDHVGPVPQELKFANCEQVNVSSSMV